MGNPASKMCTRCLKSKPLTDFSRDKGRRDGRACWCRACKTEHRRGYRQDHREAELEKQRRHYEANRAAVLAHYSPGSPPCCACCGTTGDLSIDHIGGNGGEHRRALFGATRGNSGGFYRWLIRQGFPPGFSILCQPCNASKANGECCRLGHQAA